MTVRSERRRQSFPVPGLGLLGLFDRLDRAQVRYRQMRSLERLDEHLMRDIGITPADIRRELRRSLWG